MYRPHITGVALAHMIGHNLNMGHDQDGSFFSSEFKVSLNL
jgi:hypothetical protein